VLNEAAGGLRAPRPEALRLFRLWWHLGEICGYVARFREQHGDTADDKVAWGALADYLRVEQNWRDLIAGHYST
jgi:hypothetical protein